MAGRSQARAASGESSRSQVPAEERRSRRGREELRMGRERRTVRAEARRAGPHGHHSKSELRRAEVRRRRDH